MPTNSGDLRVESFPAAGALAEQVFVTINASGQVALPSAGAMAYGVTLEAASAAGDVIAIAVIQGGGKCRVRAGAAVTAGARVMAAADGEAIDVTATNTSLGLALEGGADQEEISILLGYLGAAS